MATRWVIAAVVVAAGGLGTVAADPTPIPAEVGKWVARVRPMVPAGWTVSARGADLVIQRDKPVEFAVVRPNSAIGQFPELENRPYRLTLRFGPKLSADEYDRLAAVNALSAKEEERLYGTVRNVTHKFREFSPVTPEERERVRAYHAAVAKLPRHDLPDLYTPDHSMTLVTAESGGWVAGIQDDRTRAECDAVRRRVLRPFGRYDPRFAADD